MTHNNQWLTVAIIINFHRNKITYRAIVLRNDLIFFKLCTEPITFINIHFSIAVTFDVELSLWDGTLLYSTIIQIQKSWIQ